MELVFMPKGKLQVDDAQLRFMNFRGEGGPYNREGDQNFQWKIPDRDLTQDEVESLLDIYPELKMGTDEDGCPVVVTPKNEYIVSVDDALVYLGWNLKIKDPIEEGGERDIKMKVKVKFNDRGPVAWLVSGRNRRRLNEKTIGMIDSMDIIQIDMDIRPYDWEMNGKTGRSAYLDSIAVTQDINRFDERYAEDEYPEE